MARTCLGSKHSRATVTRSLRKTTGINSKLAKKIQSANADVISERKAGFKTNAASMKAIASAIGGGDYQTVINQANTISNWAHKIPGYFPEGSGFGDTKARAEIWTNFDDFTALSKANETAANKLVTAAKSGDPDAMMAGLKNLGGSCKARHSLYKD